MERKNVGTPFEGIRRRKDTTVPEKRNKGITLIALVITIIVMLILAGIVLTMTIGENGIINKTIFASEQTKISDYKEKIELSRATVAMNNFGDVTLDNLIEQIYQDKIVERGSITKAEDGKSATIITKEGYIFLITADTVEYIGKGEAAATKKEAVLEASQVVDGKVTLKIKAGLPGETITRVEIKNVSGTTVETVELQAQISQIEQEKSIYVPFYKEQEYTAKIIGSSSTIESNKVSNIKNEDCIANREDLITLEKLLNDKKDNFENKTIRQVENIDFGMYVTKPIGRSSYPFKGTYDGQGHTIRNLRIDSSSSMQGLFGYIESATIKNIVLGEGTVTGANRVGSAVGYALNSNIEGITNEGVSVKANTGYTESCASYDYATDTIGTFNPTTSVSLGGICGKAENTTVSNCTNKKTVSVEQNSTLRFIGGIVGYAKSDTVKKIENCTNSANIINGSELGGIVGLISGKVQVNNCTNTDEGRLYTFTSSAGGIIGGAWTIADNNGTEINGCVNNANVTSTVYTGGIIGWCASSNEVSSPYCYEINNCINTGNITSTSYSVFGVKNGNSTSNANAAQVGGIVGEAIRVKIDSCKNEGNINGVNKGAGIGGIAGIIVDSSIEKSSNVGDINTNNVEITGAGGILGVGSEIAVRSSYNKGTVKAYSCGGGIIGYSYMTWINNCYNVGEITSTIYASGIVGWVGPANVLNYELKNCYNIGTITGTRDMGGISGYVKNLDVNYAHSLTGKASSNWGQYISNTGTKTDMLDETNLKSTVSSWDAFEEDPGNLNGGYPVLSWQIPK